MLRVMCLLTVVLFLLLSFLEPFFSFCYFSLFLLLLLLYYLVRKAAIMRACFLLSFYRERKGKVIKTKRKWGDTGIGILVSVPFRLRQLVVLVKVSLLICFV